MIDKNLVKKKIEEFNKVKDELIELIGDDNCVSELRKINSERIKEGILDAVENEYRIDDMDLVFRRLYKTTDIDEAYLLCKNLEGKCFKRGNRYIIIHKVNRDENSGYITAVESSVAKTKDHGTWEYETRITLRYKDNSEHPIWSTGKCSRIFEYEDYVMEEIPIEEFRLYFWNAIYDYYCDTVNLDNGGINIENGDDLVIKIK